MLVAVVRRLWHASLAALIQSLICVIARAVLATANLALLTSLLQSISLPSREVSEPDVNGLQGALTCWVAHHPKIIGGPAIRLSTRALEVLLDQPALQVVMLLPWTSPHAPLPKIRCLPQPQPAACVVMEVLARSVQNESAKARGNYEFVDHAKDLCNYSTEAGDDSDVALTGLCSMGMFDAEEEEVRFRDVHPQSTSVVQTLKRFARDNPKLANTNVHELLQSMHE